MSNFRLIDAEKLFEKVGRIKPRNKEHYKAIGEFMNMITNSETIVLQDDWIPVSEPPKENGDYIVSLEDSVYPWGRFFNGKWFMLSTDGIAREFSEYEVMAWMPLPEPYNEGEDNEFFCGSAERRAEQAKIEQLEHDILYEPTFSEEEGSM